jgi:hypothetical protein
VSVTEAVGNSLLSQSTLVSREGCEECLLNFLGLYCEGKQLPQYATPRPGNVTSGPENFILIAAV